MKYNIFLVLVILFLIPISLFGQKAGEEDVIIYKGKVCIKQNHIQTKNDSVYFDADISLIGISLGRYQTLKLTFVVCSETDSTSLPPIILNGSNRDKMYQRALSTKNKKMLKQYDQAYVVLKNLPKTVQTISYKQVFPIQSWMENGGLVLEGVFMKDEKLLFYNRDFLIDDFYIEKIEEESEVTTSQE